MNESNPSQASGPRGRSTAVKLVVLAIVVLAAGIGYARFGNKLSLDYLATQESSLRSFRAEFPLLVYGVAFAVYVAVTGLSLPGAAGLTLLYGWFFDFLPAVITVSFASTTGATIAFLLSRYLLRDTVQNRFGGHLQRFNNALEKEGAFYLFTLRLIPAVPFFVINVVMGLTPLATKTFWWVSQLGMLPGTLVYVYAGDSVPTLAELAEQGTSGILTPRILVAFVLLGAFPLVVKSLTKKLRNDVDAETLSQD